MIPCLGAGTSDGALHSSSFRARALVLLAIGMFASPVFAKAAIHGSVTDRSGDPMSRVNVRITPGDVELVTDEQGRFTIDYLRDEGGNRTRLSRRTTYTFDVYKLGFQVAKADVEYKRGEIVLEPVTLSPDTINVRASATDVDPANGIETDAQGGGSYEGE
ncbi:MAG: carboxypeptidase regulatory-like domain-containing protein [Myxococcales bacterium]|nr:carboxypeptidase regulatory-like domain-containing protein [Myxococcales bacterium]